MSSYEYFYCKDDSLLFMIKINTKLNQPRFRLGLCVDFV